ncbi:hypothetical protein BDZ94DRAFT_1243420 [Collybia nuda]|uniref:PB1 domain-containing protein n=1 Tax=Collybia nuda TaxID=64659 RepID=A0A9P5YJ33_9AGAR|nr:hypothetical protein BDZ94DRAFT_1243420 [Collybia nuda]
MSPTHFKLLQRDGLTRRISFPDLPTWPALATRIESLYSIPFEKLSVAYIDVDGDEVTLSSQEELQDFYQVSHESGQIIKFIVQDLASSRVRSNEIPHSPQGVNFRHTFGQEGSFGIDDDWQPLPPFSGIGGITVTKTEGSESPHAFVEVLSDLNSNHNDFNVVSDDDNSTILFHPANLRSSGQVGTGVKGKEKASVTDDISSTGSVLGEDAPPKHPLHVYDINSRDHDHGQPGLSSFDRVSSETSDRSALPIVAESTPKNIAQMLPEHEGGDAKHVPAASEPSQQAEDPPLPSLDPASFGAPNSLSDDIASLLGTFSGVVAAHPELSEGIRNIIRNASTGAYWNAHKDFVSRAAGSLAQNVGTAAEDLRKRSEDEAGQRVADALGDMFRTLSQSISPENNANNGTAQPPTTSVEGSDRVTDPVPTNSTSFWYGTPPSRPPAGWRGGSSQHLPRVPWRSRPFGQSWSSWIPPSHLHGMHRNSPLGPRGDYVAQGPPPPPPGNWFPGPLRPFEPLPPPPPPAPPHEISRSKQTPQELKAQVEEAKLRYKAEKEKYRLEREERRKERERKVQTTGAEAPVQVPPLDNSGPVTSPVPPAGPSKIKSAAIVSTGRAGYPALELVSVHRHNTHPGHSSRRHGPEHSDPASRTLSRISKRLADMGFTENAYPDLPSKIRAQMPPSGIISKDGEDDIVTTMLEELLAMSPKPPAHSAFGAGDRDVPGAWH